MKKSFMGLVVALFLSLSLINLHAQPRGVVAAKVRTTTWVQA